MRNVAKNLVVVTVFLFSSISIAEEVQELRLKMIPDKVAQTKNGDIEIENGVFEKELTIRSDGTAKIQAMECKRVYGSTILCLHGGMSGKFVTFDLDKMRYVSTSMLSYGDSNVGFLEMGILRNAE